MFLGRILASQLHRLPDRRPGKRCVQTKQQHADICRPLHGIVFALVLAEPQVQREERRGIVDLLGTTDHRRDCHRVQPMHQVQELG